MKPTVIFFLTILTLGLVSLSITQATLAAYSTQTQVQAAIKARQKAFPKMVPVTQKQKAIKESVKKETRKSSPRPTNTPKPSAKPTAKPTPIPPTPTAIPQPTKAPVKQAQPTQVPLTADPTTIAKSDDKATGLLGAANDYRASKGKSPLKSRNDLCQLTQSRAEQIVDNFSHEGFRDMADSGDFDDLQYQAIAENIWRGRGSDERVVTDWSNSSGHDKNLLGDWTWGCGVRYASVAVFLFLR